MSQNLKIALMAIGVAAAFPIQAAALEGTVSPPAPSTDVHQLKTPLELSVADGVIKRVCGFEKKCTEWGISGTIPPHITCKGWGYMVILCPK
jgi:hypothetical protein